MKSMTNIEERRPKWIEWVAERFSHEAETDSNGNFRNLLLEAARSELVDQDALNIVYRVLQVIDMRARDVMIPRSQLVVVKANDPPVELLKLVIDSGHSRFPVVGDDLDEVKGILHAKDILPWILLDENGLSSLNIKDLMRPALFCPESHRLVPLLQTFRRDRSHMAIVVDEFGHNSGVVTIEDVLEQIVGDIEDEHDTADESYVSQLDEWSFNVKASMPIDEFNEKFNSSFSEKGYDTIGGIVLKELGRFPTNGESIKINGLEFTVLNADSRRVELLHLRCPIH